MSAIRLLRPDAVFRRPASPEGKRLLEQAKTVSESARRPLIKRSNACLAGAVHAAKDRGGISTIGFDFELLSPDWGLIDDQIARLEAIDDEPQIIYVVGQELCS
jgi:hypothetical protein